MAQEDLKQGCEENSSERKLKFLPENGRQWATRLIIVGPYLMGLISVAVSVAAIAMVSQQTGRSEVPIRDVAETLQRDVEFIKHVLNTTQNDVLKLDSKLQRLDRDIKQVIGSHTTFGDVRDEVLRNLTNIESGLAQTNRQVQEMAASIEDAKEQRGELADEISHIKLNLENQRSDLTAKIQTNSEKTDDLQRETTDDLSAANRKIDELTEQIEEAESSIQNLQDDDDAINEDLLIVKRNIADLQQFRARNRDFRPSSSISLIIIAVLCWLLHQE